jgi:hypothetical protein
MTEQTMTDDQRAEQVDLDALLDANAFRYEDEETGEVSIELGPVAVFDVGGTQWLTDRYWILPRRLVRGEWPVRELEAVTRVGRGFVERLDSVALGEPSPRFAPALAGPLTVAGLTARQVLGDGEAQAHVLVNRRGQNVGWVMPMSSVVKDKTVPIPVSAEIVDMEARIVAASDVRVSESWGLAAALAKSEPLRVRR